MGGQQSVRATLVLSVLAVSVWGVLSVVWGGQPVVFTAVISPIFLGAIFFTMRMTNRITGGLLNRFGPTPPEPPPPTPPSSERPEHAQRRRDQRRHRGRGGRGRGT